MTVRYQDWPSRLSAFVASARVRPFEWSVQDCATFARDWIETATGERVFDPPYTDARSAAQYIEAQGGMRAAASAVLGEPMANPMAAGRGDVALVENAGREILGVVMGEYVAAPGGDRVLMVPRAAIVAAWSI